MCHAYLRAHVVLFIMYYYSGGGHPPPQLTQLTHHLPPNSPTVVVIVSCSAVCCCRWLLLCCYCVVVVFGSSCVLVSFDPRPCASPAGLFSRCRVLHACRSFGSRSVIPTSCVDVSPWIRSWDLKRNSLNCGCTLAWVKHLAQECCI